MTPKTQSKKNTHTDTQNHKEKVHKTTKKETKRSRERKLCMTFHRKKMIS
jgi:hypothetical protein